MSLELLLNVLPVSSSTATGYHFDPDILTYPAHHDFVMSTGWDLRNAGHYRSNNLGFLTSRDFVPNHDAIALIGDSYVEANMLPEHSRLASQLERQLHGKPVYALGGPASSLLDYDERVRFARERFKINQFVIVIERGDVMETLCGSGNIHSPCLDPDTLELRHERMAEPGLAKQLLRHSALAQYLFSQLRIKPDKLFTDLFPFTKRASLNNTSPTTATGPESISPNVTEVIVTRFLKHLPRDNGERYVLVFDSDRGAIAAGKISHTPVRDQFMAMSRAAGVTVLDTEPLFRKHQQQSPLHLDVGPYDHHWNALANQIVASELMHHLQ